jgi:hypothetical protein
MAARPDSDLQRALIVARTVLTATTVTVNSLVKDGTADHQVQPCTDGLLAIGIVVALGKLAGAAGDVVSVALLCGPCVIPVKVGTGGATRGARAKAVATGLTDGVAADATVGWFTQSGVAGDIVGLVPTRAN